MFRITALIGLMAVSACAMPEATPPSEAVMRKASNVELCQAYAISKNPYSAAVQAAVRRELARRGSVSKQDQADWNKGFVRIGMSEHVAVCSWGPYFDVNTTTGAWGVHRQYVMGQFGPYVYTENGRVTSFQN